MEEAAFWAECSWVVCWEEAAVAVTEEAEVSVVASEEAAVAVAAQLHGFDDRVSCAHTWQLFGISNRS